MVLAGRWGWSGVALRLARVLRPSRVVPTHAAVRGEYEKGMATLRDSSGGYLVVGELWSSVRITSNSTRTSTPTPVWTYM